MRDSSASRSDADEPEADGSGEPDAGGLTPVDETGGLAGAVARSRAIGLDGTVGPLERDDDAAALWLSPGTHVPEAPEDPGNDRGPAGDQQTRAAIIASAPVLDSITVDPPEPVVLAAPATEQGDAVQPQGGEDATPDGGGSFHRRGQAEWDETGPVPPLPPFPASIRVPEGVTLPPGIRLPQGVTVFDGPAHLSSPLLDPDAQIDGPDGEPVGPARTGRHAKRDDEAVDAEPVHASGDAGGADADAAPAAAAEPVADETGEGTGASEREADGPAGASAERAGEGSPAAPLPGGNESLPNSQGWSALAGEPGPDVPGGGRDGGENEDGVGEVTEAERAGPATAELEDGAAPQDMRDTAELPDAEALAAGDAATAREAAGAAAGEDSENPATSIGMDGAGSVAQSTRRTIEVDARDRAGGDDVRQLLFPAESGEDGLDVVADPPRIRNAGFAAFVACVGTAVFAALFLGAFALLRSLLMERGADIAHSATVFAPTAPFWLPVAGFGLFFLLWGVASSRTAWGSYVLGGLLSGAGAFLLYHCGVALQRSISEGAPLVDPLASLDDVAHVLGALVCAILAREVFTWCGGLIASRAGWLRGQAQGGGKA